jgi:hypothetical protein
VRIRANPKAQGASAGAGALFRLFMYNPAISASRSDFFLEKTGMTPKTREETPTYLHGPWKYLGRKPRVFRCLVFEIALFCIIPGINTGMILQYSTCTGGGPVCIICVLCIVTTVPRITRLVYIYMILYTIPVQVQRHRSAYLLNKGRRTIKYMTIYQV